MGVGAPYPAYPAPEVVSAQPPRARADAASMARTIEREDVGFGDMTDSPEVWARPAVHARLRLVLPAR
jgi:hypothetical protein